MTDALGDRMKLYEQAEAGRAALPLLPVCLRLDGRSFSAWTRGLQRPFDPRLSALMIEVTTKLVEETGALVGYTQSDEISLVLYSDDPKSELWFAGKLQKLTSVAASFATAHFNARVPALLPERSGRLACFDCRAWTVPSLEEAANVLVWREVDATKNSVSMAAREFYSHRALHGHGRADEPTFFDAHKDGADCVVLRVKDGLKLRYATLERVAGSRVLGTQAQWVLRRLDWLLPQEGRDPASVPAVTFWRPRMRLATLKL